MSLLLAPEQFAQPTLSYDYFTMSISINWETPSKPNGIIVGYLLEISVVNETTMQHQTWIQPDVHQYNYPVKVLCRYYVVKMAPATAAAIASFISEDITASSPGSLTYLCSIAFTQEPC